MESQEPGQDRGKGAGPAGGAQLPNSKLSRSSRSGEREAKRRNFATKFFYLVTARA